MSNNYRQEISWLLIILIIMLLVTPNFFKNLIKRENIRSTKALEKEYQTWRKAKEEIELEQRQHEEKLMRAAVRNVEREYFEEYEKFREYSGSSK